MKTVSVKITAECSECDGICQGVDRNGTVWSQNISGRVFQGTWEDAEPVESSIAGQWFEFEIQQ